MLSAPAVTAASPPVAAPSTGTRVLHVHSGNMLGGVEAMLLAQAAGAARTPMQVTFALCFGGEFRERLEAAGARCTPLGEPRLRSPRRVWRARRLLDGYLAANPADTVIVHSAWTQTLFAPVLRRRGVPWVRWLHAPVGRDHWLERAALRHRPALVICNSAFTRSESAWAYGEVPSRVVYCPIAAPPAGIDRADLRAGLDSATDDVVIAMVARFERLKGHDVLLRALARLARDARWTCWIVGGAQSPSESAWLAELRALACDLGIAERLRFTGQHPNVPALLTACDIYCQPNTGAEGFGLALVEALAAGVPVVTTAMGAACEIVEPDCGVLVPPADVAALAAALARLIDAPSSRARLGERGAVRAASFPNAEAHLQALGEALVPALHAARPDAFP